MKLTITELDTTDSGVPFYWVHNDLTDDAMTIDALLLCRMLGLPYADTDLQSLVGWRVSVNCVSNVSWHRVG